VLHAFDRRREPETRVGNHRQLDRPTPPRARSGLLDQHKLEDLPAVVAGLTLPYGNGPMEGANTKVKFLKRQMYGRAGFPLLRQRILLA